MKPDEAPPAAPDATAPLTFLPEGEGTARVLLSRSIAADLLPAFVSPRGLTLFVSGGCVAVALLSWLGVGVHLAALWQHYLQLRAAPGTSSQLLTVVEAVRIVRIAQRVVFVATTLAFLAWIFRLRVNVRALGVRKLVYARVWSVLGFLVPGVNVVRPYQVMAEIWRASDPSILDPFAWKSAELPRILLVWWISFVIAAALEIIALGFGTSAGVVPLKAFIASGVAAVADAAAALSASLAFFCVSRLGAAQLRKCGRLLRKAEGW